MPILKQTETDGVVTYVGVRGDAPDTIIAKHASLGYVAMMLRCDYNDRLAALERSASALHELARGDGDRGAIEYAAGNLSAAARALQFDEPGLSLCSEATRCDGLYVDAGPGRSLLVGDVEHARFVLARHASYTRVDWESGCLLGATLNALGAHGEPVRDDVAELVCQFIERGLGEVPADERPHFVAAMRSVSMRAAWAAALAVVALAGPGGGGELYRANGGTTPEGEALHAAYAQAITAEIGNADAN